MHLRTASWLASLNGSPRTGPTRLVSILFVLALAALTSGCTRWFFGGPKVPGVVFERANVREVRFDGASLQLAFRIDNPNDGPMTITSSSYDLALDGKTVASGAFTQGLSVAGHSSEDVALPVELLFKDLEGGLLGAAKKKRTTWTLSGLVTFATPVGPLPLPARASGDVDLPQPPTFSIDQPRADGVTIVGAHLVIPVRITNPTPFDLPAPSGRASLSIDGNDVGSVRRDSPDVVPAKGTLVLDLDTTLRFQDVGAGVYKLLSMGEPKIRLEGEVAFGGAVVPFELEQNAKFGRNGPKSQF
ncbi:MAG: LEA type 2 family protein [Deltaproteobacteria bacterium]|nr:LEA type 2 family protein [Deltaproteobacteria bacterium]